MEHEPISETENLKPTIEIEAARLSDAEEIRRIQADTWIATYVNPEQGVTLDGLKRRIEGENGEKIAKRIDYWRTRIETANDDHAVFIAKDSGKLIGFVAPGIIDGLRRLGALYVLPEGQGRGAGAMLLEQALEWHGDENDVYLHVADYNAPAIRFYQQHGFETTGKRFEDNANTVYDARINEVEMVRKGSVTP